LDQSEIGFGEVGLCPVDEVQEHSLVASHNLGFMLFHECHDRLIKLPVGLALLVADACMLERPVIDPGLYLFFPSMFFCA